MSFLTPGYKYKNQFFFKENVAADVLNAMIVPEHFFGK